MSSKSEKCALIIVPILLVIALVIGIAFALLDEFTTYKKLEKRVLDAENRNTLEEKRVYQLEQRQSLLESRTLQVVP